MDRHELGRFLRSRRERIAPGDLGLPVGPRRRTPGLRRDEVARLAHISVEYYTRLEQGRGPRPSPEVLTGLSRALRLDAAAAGHLRLLAGEAPPSQPGPSREVRASTLDLVDRLSDAAVIVLSADGEVLAWNRLAAAVLEDFGALPRRDRNLLRRAFLGPPGPSGRLYGMADADEFARTSVLALRGVTARYPDDPELAALVRELRAGSSEFAELWDSHDVLDRPRTCTTFRHPQVGDLALTGETLDVPGRDQRVIVWTAAPGSPEAQALRLLAVIGTQRLDVPG